MKNIFNLRNLFVVSGIVLSSVTGASAAFASTVTRSFDTIAPAPGAPVVVSLDVAVSAPDTFYIIDEVLPTGWTVSAPGTGDTIQAGHVKWAVLSGAVSTVLSYTITAPASGTGTFSGQYAFDSNPAPVSVLGATDVTVAVPVVVPPPPPAPAPEPTPAPIPVSTSTVTRSFSTATPTAGSSLSVSLDVNVTAPDTTAPNDFYIIDEVLPTGWVVTSPGTGDTTQTGHIKWAVLSGAVSTIDQYTVTVPSSALGVSTFGGDFAFGSSVTPLPMLGATSVDVQAVPPPPAPAPTPAPVPTPTPTPTPTPVPTPTPASTVTRSFDTIAPAPGAPVVVSLDVAVSAPDTFYIIDEVLPT
ncbi:MAG: hypothetical protein WA058_01040, partial [Minisyncoccia bacterium]